MRTALKLVGILALLAVLAPQAGRTADKPTPSKNRVSDLLGQKKLLPLLGETPSAGAGSADSKPIVRAGLVQSSAKKGDVITLAISVVLPPETHTYSLNDGLAATRISVTEEKGLAPKGDFEPDHAPTIATDEITGRPTETFDRGVTWLRHYVMTADAPADVRVAGKVDLKYCNQTVCRASTEEFKAQLASRSTPSASQPATASSNASARFRQVVSPSYPGQASPVELSFELVPSNPQPKSDVTLTITMKLEPGWHTYSTTQKEEIGSTPTTIKIESTKDLRPFGDRFHASRPPELLKSVIQPGDAKEAYHGEVTWGRRFQFDPAAGPTGLGVKGEIHFGVCDSEKCLPPKTVRFALGDLEGAGPPPTALPDDRSVGADHVDQKVVAAEKSLWSYLGAAFLGGIILNIMPCVLPVLAVKVLSFVQQAHESRSRVLLLNLSYTAGILAVFLTLATLAVGTRLGLKFTGDFSWGGLFQQTRFNLVMACLVFAMGLSLLGVFEIPVPGMIGSAAGRQHREGFLGAFLTGIFATLLATPCLGPFMGTAVFWAIEQPTQVAYLFFALMGLGMASPYVLCGLFPQLVKWLPKPGNWMIRFKEFAGFVLLGSVIFIIHYTDEKFTIPLLVMLLGIALGLWMIGNLYDINSHIRHKTLVRTTAIALTTLICWFGYDLAAKRPYELPWEPFSEEKVESLLKQNKTVLVDFTAKWCINCHVNEYVALNTKKTLELVQEHGVVPLVADFSNESPEIRRWLTRFEQIGVPLTVIFPAGRQRTPLILTGVYTQGMLLEKLNEAITPDSKSAVAVSTASESGPNTKLE